MTFSMRDKKILLMFLGVLCLVLSYLFVYRPQMEEAETIEAENIPLQTRLEELLAMAQKKEYYEQQTREMQIQIDDYCKNFPAVVREEDGIVLAQNMENTMDMQISNVGLGQPELVYSMDGEEPGSAPGQEDQTLMEQGDAITQEQIAEIEGTTGEDTSKDMLPSETEMAGMLIDIITTPNLYRTQDTLQFSCTYDSLKRSVKFLASQSGRMTLNNVNASFDPSTGNLTGTMAVNMFSMTGVGSTYTAPDAGSVPYGTDNIFGTLEAPAETGEEGADPAAGEEAPSEGETPPAEGDAAPAEGETSPQ